MSLETEVSLAFCSACHDYRPTDELVWRTHHFAGARVQNLVCKRCAEEEPCPRTFNGVHGEIWDCDDLEEDDRWPPEKELPWFIVELLISGVQELEYCNYKGRLGICSLCKQWQVWSIPDQRWQDPVLLW